MPPSTQKPTIVFIHGVWHDPPLYQKFRTALNAPSFEGHTPRLLMLNGSRPPNADLYSDADLIRTYVTSIVDAGREVMVLMHSYGGQVGTNALAGLGVQRRQQDGLPGRVTRLVYLSAFALKEGTSMGNVVERFGHTDSIPLGMDIAADKSFVNRDPLSLLLGPGLTLEGEEGYLRCLKRWNVTVMYQVIEAAAWRDIPVSYVQPTEDLSLPIDYQKWMIGEMEAEGKEV